MPLPKPRKGEERLNFVSRCVAQLTRSGEFDDVNQRAAVCNSEWKRDKALIKVSGPRFLGRTFRRVETRSKPFARQLERVLRRIEASELARQNKVRKATDAELKAALRRVVVRFARAQGQDAALTAARIVQTDFPTARIPLEDLEAIIDERVADILETTLETVRSNIKEAASTAEAMGESSTDAKRRIRQRIIEGGSTSFERAETIARTELARAENMGIVAGYEATGVKRLEWFAFQSPIWPRRHDTMDGKTIAIGGKFTLPSGVKLRFPHDPEGPASEVINCRCTVGPIGRRRRQR